VSGLRVRDEDRRCDGNAERAADLLARVQQSRREPGLLRSDSDKGSDADGYERERQPNRERQVERQRAPVLPSTGSRV
jgi:hypothetical protein